MGARLGYSLDFVGQLNAIAVIDVIYYPKKLFLVLLPFGYYVKHNDLDNNY